MASIGSSEDESLSAPLLNGKGETIGELHQTKLGQASFISRLILSWMNPLLHLGYSKPLVLEDIPSLVPEDEAFLAHKKFLKCMGSTEERSLPRRGWKFGYQGLS
ncbi:hypothetical protein F0562_016151 [Nyssa sinensis]|uniref:Uncharacterized protein n=1 Tax=Nyssa sinensis TaxID=561372 RepID=A0A5J4ZN85_9ASTE|nr:hypothetical protein F0562_016151 [Nyssa sinensis]